MISKIIAAVGVLVFITAATAVAALCKDSGNYKVSAETLRCIRVKRRQLRLHSAAVQSAVVRRNAAAVLQ